jgi:predicted protein tyrosine phosphatase
MEQTLRHTSELVNQFRHHLLNRRKHCYDILDELDELQYTTIEILTEEIERIDSIFKLMEKGKI